MIRSLVEIEKIRAEGSSAIINESRKIYNNSFVIKGSLGSDWKYVGSGRHRTVYKRGNVVLKIPQSLNALEDNIIEREIFINSRGNKIFAPCRLLSNGCLMMRALEDLYGSRKLHPHWAMALVDGPQIGRDQNGKIMIYDYAEEYY